MLPSSTVRVVVPSGQPLGSCRRAVVLGPRTAPRAVVADDPTGRRRGLTTEVPPGAYSRTTAWSSSRGWLAGLRLGLRAEPWRLRLDDHDAVGLDTFMRVLALMAETAEHSTGRRIQATRRAVAAAAGCSEATVTRVTRIASRSVGCLHLVVRGRPLTMAERTVVRHRRQRGQQLRQRGVAPVWAAHTPAWLRPYVALATPRTLSTGRSTTAALAACGCRGQAPAARRPVDNPALSGTRSDLQPVCSATHPRRALAPRKPHLENTPTCAHCNGVAALQADGLRPTPRRKQARTRRKPSGAALAAQIVSQVFWARDVPARRVASHLAPLEQAGWTAREWLRVADTILGTPGAAAAGPPTGVRSAGGWIHWLSTQMTPGPPPAHDRPTPATPCGGPRCDGHGWLERAPEDHGPVSVCPACPPAVRATSWRDPDHWTDADDQACDPAAAVDPPF